MAKSKSVLASSMDCNLFAALWSKDVTFPERTIFSRQVIIGRFEESPWNLFNLPRASNTIGPWAIFNNSDLRYWSKPK